jgi:hypothetical protein
MSARGDRVGTVGMVRDAARVTAAGAALAAIAALVVVVVGAGHALRGWYRLHPSSPSSVTAAHVFSNNAKVCGLALLVAVYLRFWPRVRWVSDPVLALLLAVNAVLVGAALGAYGAPLLRLIAAHATLELLAAGAAGAGYLRARRETVPLASLAWCAVTTAGLLLAAAILEAHYL